MEQGANKYSVCNLRSSSYRYLQQMAKSLNLPSNVKKMYLIELIYTKRTKSAGELEELVQRVKLERKQLANARRANKKKVQAAEVTSTWAASPPVTRTSKRHSDVTKHSPDLTLNRKTEVRQMSSVLKVYPPRTRPNSDRVLRSSRERPNYRIMNTNNNLIGVIKAQSPKSTKINIISRGSRPKFNLTAIVKKRSCEINRDRQMVPYNRNMPTPPSSLRERRLSGISPLKTQEQPMFTPTLNFTRRDGSTSKINVLVHKPMQAGYTRDKETHRMEEQATQTSEYDSVLCLAELLQQKMESTRPDGHSGMKCVEDCEYYHKKIRAEHVRVRASLDGSGGGGVEAPEVSLPAIAHVFSRLGARQGLTQPLYVEVSTEAERTLSFPAPASAGASAGACAGAGVGAGAGAALLERLYTLRARAPALLQRAPAARTTCVYSTGTVSSVLLPPTVLEEYNASYLRDSFYESAGLSRENVYLSAAEQEALRRVFICDEVLSPSPLPSGAAVSAEMSAEMSAGVSAEMSAGVSAEMSAGVSAEMSAGVSAEMSAGISAGVSAEMSAEMSSGVTVEMSAGVSAEMSAGISAGVSAEMSAGVSAEMSGGVPAEMTATDSGPVSTTATIPQMVEDAFELISQDGDYMERIGMEERTRCFLCAWAGPNFILEHHIRKEHAEQIENVEDGTCHLRFSLASLAARSDASGDTQGDAQGDMWEGWAGDRRLLSYGGRLLLLSAKYEDPQHFTAAIHSLSEEADAWCKLTVYNKVSGLPLEWRGRVLALWVAPPGVPPAAPPAAPSLRLPLAAIDVLPNSARLRLLNRELVGPTSPPSPSGPAPADPARVLVGAPALHHIYIDLFVQLWD